MNTDYSRLLSIGINVTKCIVLLLIVAPQLSYAEVKAIKCTYLLPQWKMNDLSEYAGCPSGSAGLGKPWRWDTFTFDLTHDSKTTPVEIKESYCMGTDNTFTGNLTSSPSLLIIKYQAHAPKEISINRETLIGDHGEKCELIEVKASKNKI